MFVVVLFFGHVQLLGFIIVKIFWSCSNFKFCHIYSVMWISLQLKPNSAGSYFVSYWKTQNNQIEWMNESVYSLKLTTFINENNFVIILNAWSIYQYMWNNVVYNKRYKYYNMNGLILICTCKYCILIFCTYPQVLLAFAFLVPLRNISRFTSEITKCADNPEIGLSMLSVFASLDMKLPSTLK